MLDPDISAADALMLLSQPDLADVAGPSGWTRRKFLQAVGGGVVGGVSLGALGPGRFGLHPLGLGGGAFSASPIGGHDGIVLNILLYRRNDGLNTGVPYTN